MQLLQLVPLAGVPELAHELYELAGHISSRSGPAAHQTRTAMGVGVRQYYTSGAYPMDPKLVKTYLAALKAHPRHLGLYGMMRWNTTLQVSRG